MRLLLVSLLLLAIAASSTAQTTVGVRAGYGQSSLRSGNTFDVVTDQTDGVGATSAGIFVAIPVTKWLTLRPGLEYNQRGTSIGLTEGVALLGVKLPVGARAKTTFSYVDAPLLAQLNLPTDGRIQPYALIGPSLGYAVSGRLRTSARALIDFTISNTDVNLDAINYERFHVAAIGGLGLSGQLSESTRMFVEAQYEHGLTQPYNVPLVRDGVGFRGWNVGAGLSFAL